MKEKRQALYVLFQEENIDKAKEHARQHMAQSVVDYEIESIKETNILDVFAQREAMEELSRLGASIEVRT